MTIFDGNEIRQLAMRIGTDDNANDNDDEVAAANGNNVCMQCKLDKCVYAQRAMRCAYERNDCEKCLRSNNQKLFSVRKMAVDKFLQDKGAQTKERKK